MSRYDTPVELAEILAKHAQPKISSLLEPSVGRGVLLEAILSHIDGCAKNIICIDNDKKALKHVQLRFNSLLKNSLKVVHKDFLEWANGENTPWLSFFDCVIMNPPFSGRLEKLVKIDLKKTTHDNYIGERSVSLEAAFLIKALRHLKPGGKLLSVVPASIISSYGTTWLRKYMVENGYVKRVYELPRYAFKSVDTSVYLLVFIKSVTQKKITLCNHNPFKPKNILLNKGNLDYSFRLDFSFYYAHNLYQQLINRSAHLGWTKLENLANIYRGTLASPLGSEKALHTCDYHNGLWYCDDRNKILSKDISEKGIKKGDLLIKRVGRRCAQSVGKVVGHVGCTCSDCILILRPKFLNISLKLLFSLRVLFVTGQFSPLLERGTGAKYITERILLNLCVPIELDSKNPKLYSEYRVAVARKRTDFMTTIEYNMWGYISSGFK